MNSNDELCAYSFISKSVHMTHVYIAIYCMTSLQFSSYPFLISTFQTFSYGGKQDRDAFFSSPNYFFLIVKRAYTCFGKSNYFTLRIPFLDFLTYLYSIRYNVPQLGERCRFLAYLTETQSKSIKTQEQEVVYFGKKSSV